MQEPLKLLKSYWGYSEFRPVQSEIISAVLENKDALALLPTGGGKSICYQIPALIKEGVCIVISPLIALMKDQVDQLKSRNIKADAIYSGMHYKEIERIFDNAIYGDTKLLYISPERLHSELAIAKIAQMNISFIAVDEAHCVSQWGHDFRPAYLNINRFRELFPKVSILAVTATATPDVAIDICNQLELRNAALFKSGFTRPNLSYAVLHEEAKLVKLLELTQKLKGSGLVYVRNRRETKEISMFLGRNNIKADFYHAGLASQDRFEKQSSWLRNEIRIMVCTNAFGMGIDKADVRFVIHMNLPDTLEAYFQEAGRAGRDEKKAYAILLYNQNDKTTLETNFENSYPPLEIVRKVYHALGSYYQIAEGSAEGLSFDFDIVSFCTNFKFEPPVTFSSLKILEQAGWINLSEAFFQAPRIEIPVEREKIYNFQLQNPVYDKLITAIMRLHQGVFKQEVRLEEIKMSKLTGLDIAEIHKKLIYLDQLELINYYPKKEMPQLTFLRPRIDSKLLTIDMARFNFLKSRAKEKMDAAIAYAYSIQCRNISLLTYFGEDAQKSCGICDICVQEKRSTRTHENKQILNEKLLEIFKTQDIKVNELLSMFKADEKQDILDLLQYFVNEEIIVIKDGVKILLNR